MNKSIEDLKLNILDINEFSKENTALLVVDMVKGFVEEGVLSSPRVLNMATNLLHLNDRLRDYKKVYFVDSHSEQCMEFKAYPPHCIANTKEEELIDGLKETLYFEKNITLVKKNSTNGFHAPDFKAWLQSSQEQISNFIIVGCVTDICVLQFALTLKTYFNEVNMDKRVIIPANCVETFDIPGHDGDEMNYFALTLMASNGIEVVKEIN